MIFSGYGIYINPGSAQTDMDLVDFTFITNNHPVDAL
jgi:hypothetical protein